MMLPLLVDCLLVLISLNHFLFLFKLKRQLEQAQPSTTKRLKVGVNFKAQGKWLAFFLWFSVGFA
jgi:hypothetical protein